MSILRRMLIKVLTKSGGRLTQLILLIVIVFEAGGDLSRLGIIDLFVISKSSTDTLFDDGFCRLCKSQGVAVIFHLGDAFLEQ